MVDTIMKTYENSFPIRHMMRFDHGQLKTGTMSTVDWVGV